MTEHDTNGSDGRQDVTAHRGFFPVVIGDSVGVKQAGGQVFLSRGDLSVTQGGGQMFITTGNLSIDQGGGQMLVAGGDVSIDQGGAGITVGRSVMASRSYVGFAFGKSVMISDDSKVILGTPQAAVFGAAFGLVVLILGMFFRRGRSK